MTDLLGLHKMAITWASLVDHSAFCSGCPVATAVGSIFAAIVYMHVASSHYSTQWLEATWQGSQLLQVLPVQNMRHTILHHVMGAMAAGSITSYMSMHLADVRSAVATVQASIPAIVAGTMVFGARDDQARPSLLLLAV